MYMNGSNTDIFKKNSVSSNTHPYETAAQPVFIIAKATYQMNSVSGGRERRRLWRIEEISSINSDHGLS